MMTREQCEKVVADEIEVISQNQMLTPLQIAHVKSVLRSWVEIEYSLKPAIAEVLISLNVDKFPELADDESILCKSVERLRGFVKLA